jgi:hypothetical protein
MVFQVLPEVIDEPADFAATIRARIIPNRKTTKAPIQPAIIVA